METAAAKELLATTFSQPFEKDRFRLFAKNLLKDFEEKTFVYSGMTIPDAYKESISTLERVGKYVDRDGQKIDILIVRLCRETSLENARTRQRNFIAWYLEHSRKGNPKDAGLVAFVSPDASDWRLSLVKMEYNLVQAESGKVKAEKHLTPARRFSFLVGETENTHTAQSRFLPLLLEDDKYPTLQDLGAAFSVEAITEEFFARYRELFLQLEETIVEIVKKDSVVKTEFESKGITTIDFAKKLLGQIVFLYFIQKKGWLGVERDSEWGTGPKDFLRKLFNEKVIKYKNFFNDALEFLFYDMLAVDKGAACWHDKFNCRIPFLNGGLFEPIFDYDWKKTEIIIPDEVFSNRTDPNDLESGSGILDIFDRYNFTVKEDEPLEKEVAVDPELLGKVFENLLEVKDRKSKGSYYTPREVVHYMCQESLISYLANGLADEVTREDLSAFIKYGELGVFNDARVEREGRETDTYFYKIPEAVRDHAQEIDDLLKNIKVCDPAVGSGAFPMGMINEIVRARWSLNPFLFDGQVEGIKGREFYDLKWHTIQESIYGVDLDAGAVEIAKLRLWLSLVVDEQSIEKIRPLPNLDFKIMQGNSLLEEFEGLKLFDERLVRANADIDQQIEKLKSERTSLNLELKEAFANSGVIPKDGELSKRSKANEKRMAALLGKKKAMEHKHQAGFAGFGNSAAEKLEHLKGLQRQFFSASHKSDKERLRKELDSLEWELIEVSLKEQGKADSMDKLRTYQRMNSKPYFLWQLNFSDVFEGKGGFDVVIANPPYGANLGSDLEVYVAAYPESTKGIRDLYKMFMDLSLRKLSHLEGLMCFIVPNTFLTQPKYVDIRKLLLAFKVEEITNLGDGVFPQVVVPTCVIRTSKLASEAGLSFIDITSAYQFQGFQFQGCSTIAKQDQILQSADLMFIPDRRTSKSDEVALGEVMDCRDAGIQYAAPGVGRLNKGQAKLGERLLYQGASTHTKDIPLLVGSDISRWSIASCPNNFLRHDWDNIINHDKGEWFHYSVHIFKAEKRIIWRQTSDVIIAALDCSRHWFKKSVHGGVIWKDKESLFDYYYILGLLNSQYINSLYIQLSREKGRVFPQVKITKIKQLPIKVCTVAEQQPIINIVKKLCSLSVRTTKLEKEVIDEIDKLEGSLNALVYDLYKVPLMEVKKIEAILCNKEQ